MAEADKNGSVSLMYKWQSSGRKLHLREKIKLLSKSLLLPVQVIQINKRYPTDPGLKWKQPKVKVIYAHMLWVSKHIYIKYLIHRATASFLSFLWLFCCVLLFLPEVLQYLLWHYFDTSKYGRTGENVMSWWVHDSFKAETLKFHFPLFFQLVQTLPQTLTWLRISKISL